MSGGLERTEREGETCFKVSLRNASPVPAVQVWLEVIGGSQGDEILPAFWSDNGVTLIPGERRELSVRFRKNLLGTNSAHLMAEGWNVTPREWQVADGRAIPLALEIVRCDVGRESGIIRVHFSATQRGVVGPRWTTWPVPLKVDGTVVRWLRVGLKTGVTNSAAATLTNLAPGKHRVAVGNSPEQTIN